MFEDLKLSDRNQAASSEQDACNADEPPTSYGTIDDKQSTSNPFQQNLSMEKTEEEEQANDPKGKPKSNEQTASLEETDAETRDRPSLGQYLLSIIFMPKSLRLLCLTNLFCWMAHVCYSLYFTDFVGESVFLGDPKAPDGSVEYELYNAGIRFGCWGMAMYSLSCALYSMVIEKFIRTYGYVFVTELCIEFHRNCAENNHFKNHLEQRIHTSEDYCSTVLACVLWH